MWQVDPAQYPGRPAAVDDRRGLPALAWAEKNGTVTNSERGISRQRPFLPAPGVARPDWWIVAEVARRLGFSEAFAWNGVADIFREHAALSAFENDGRRDFDIGAHAGIDDAGYDTRAGTNCGSCRPELRALLRALRQSEAA